MKKVLFFIVSAVIVTACDNADNYMTDNVTRAQGDRYGYCVERGEGYRYNCGRDRDYCYDNCYRRNGDRDYCYDDCYSRNGDSSYRYADGGRRHHRYNDCGGRRHHRHCNY